MTPMEAQLDASVREASDRGLRVSHRPLKASLEDLQRLLGYVVPPSKEVSIQGLVMHYLDNRLIGAEILITNNVPDGFTWRDRDGEYQSSHNHQPLLNAVSAQLIRQVPEFKMQWDTHTLKAPGMTADFGYNMRQSFSVTIVCQSLTRSIYSVDEQRLLTARSPAAKGYAFGQGCVEGKELLTPSIANGLPRIAWNATKSAFAADPRYRFVKGEGRWGQDRLLVEGDDTAGTCAGGVRVRRITAILNGLGEFDELHMALEPLISYSDVVFLKYRVAEIFGVVAPNNGNSSVRVLDFGQWHLRVYLDIDEETMTPYLTVQREYENPHPTLARSDLRYGLAGIPFGTPFEDVKSIITTEKNYEKRDVPTHHDTCIADRKRVDVSERVRYLVSSDPSTEQLVLGYDFYQSLVDRDGELLRDRNGEFTPRYTLIGGRVIVVNRARDLFKEIGNNLDAMFRGSARTSVGSSDYWDVAGLYIRLSRDTDIQTSLNVHDLRLITFLDAAMPRRTDKGIPTSIYQELAAKESVGLGDDFASFNLTWKVKFGTEWVLKIDAEARRLVEFGFRECVAGSRDADECSNLLGRMANNRDLDTVNMCSLLQADRKSDCREYGREKLRIWNARLADACRGQATSACAWLCPEQPLLDCMATPSISVQDKARARFFIPLVHIPQSPM